VALQIGSTPFRNTSDDIAVSVFAPDAIVTGHVTSATCTGVVTPASSPESGEYSIRGFCTLSYSIRGYSIRGYSMRGVPTASYSMRGYSMRGYSIRGYSMRGYSIRGYSIRGLVTSVTGVMSGLTTPAVKNVNCRERISGW
jgi:hypothetical protein